MATHVTQTWGQPWSGTTEDLVRLADEGQEIVRSAAGEDMKHWSVAVDLEGGRESTYTTAEELLAGLTPSSISKVTAVTIMFNSSGIKLSAAARLDRGPRRRPFVRVRGTEPSTVDGVASRLAGLFPGPRLGWQGLRRPGEISPLRRTRTHVRTLIMFVTTVAVTAAITVAVTMYVTHLLK